MLFTIINTNLATIIACLYGISKCRKYKQEEYIPACIILGACVGMIAYGLSNLIFGGV